MKSEKAKRLLNNGRFHVFCLKGEYPEQRFSPEGKYIEYAQGVSAVDLAEHEAEDRMRERAIKAHRACCPLNELQCIHRDRDDYTCTYDCRYVTSFVQKLNERNEKLFD